MKEINGIKYAESEEEIRQHTVLKAGGSCQYCESRKFLTHAHIKSRRYKEMDLRLDNRLYLCQKCHDAYDNKKRRIGLDGNSRCGDDIAIVIIGQEKWDELNDRARELRRGDNL